MKHIDIAPEDTSVALEQIAEQIALEALSVTAVINRVADLLPDLVNSAKMFLSNNNRDKPTLGPLTVNPSTLEKALTPTTFTNIATLTHPVPPGFKGNLYEYSTVLGAALEFAMTVPSAVTDFNVFLSKMLSSEQARKNSRSAADAFRERSKDRKNLLEANAPFFSAGSRITMSKYGDVIGSNAQYLQFHEQVQKMLELSSEIKLAAVEKLVQDCHELLDALSVGAAENRLDGLSPEMLEAIGLATESVARDVEFYSLTLWGLSGLRESAQKGGESMIRALRY